MRDEALLAALREKCRREIAAAEQPRYACILGEVSMEGDTLYLCGMRLCSAALRAHLRGCEKALVLAATLGGGVDRLIARHSAENIAKGYITDVLASERIEAYCDELQASLPTDGFYMRPRFSPGYGDFALEEQGTLLQALDAGRALGLYCTQGGMLTPVKSITAVIGLTREKQSCHIHKCAGCEKKDCAFQRAKKEVGA